MSQATQCKLLIIQGLRANTVANDEQEIRGCLFDTFKVKVNIYINFLLFEILIILLLHRRSLLVASILGVVFFFFNKTDFHRKRIRNRPLY